MIGCVKDCLNCQLEKCPHDIDEKERQRAAVQRYYERNKETIKQKHRERYAQNREERLRKSKEYYYAHKDEINKKRKERGKVG